MLKEQHRKHKENQWESREGNKTRLIPDNCCLCSWNYRLIYQMQKVTVFIPSIGSEVSCYYLSAPVLYLHLFWSVSLIMWRELSGDTESKSTLGRGETGGVKCKNSLVGSPAPIYINNSTGEDDKHFIELHSYLFSTHLRLGKIIFKNRNWQTFRKLSFRIVQSETFYFSQTSDIFFAHCCPIFFLCDWLK